MPNIRIHAPEKSGRCGRIFGAGGRGLFCAVDRFDFRLPRNDSSRFRNSAVRRSFSGSDSFHLSLGVISAVRAKNRIVLIFLDVISDPFASYVIGVFVGVWVAL